MDYRNEHNKTIQGSLGQYLTQGIEKFLLCVWCICCCRTCFSELSYITFFNLPRPATATAAATATATTTTTTTATAYRLRSQKLHIVLWGLHVGLVL